MTEKRIQTLIASVKESIAKTHDLVLQLEAAVGGENPVGEVIGFWRDEWHRVYNGDYDITKADAGNFKRLVTKHGRVEMRQRLVRFLIDKDAFLVRQKHPLAIFFTRVNAYSTPAGGNVAGTARDELDAAAPVDCHHEPPCRDDVQHTMKRRQEMRA